MGEALLRQPDGMYTIWSTTHDSIVAFDLTADEYRDGLAAEAALRAARAADQHRDILAADAALRAARTAAHALDRADTLGTSSRTGRTFQATVIQARLALAQARRTPPADAEPDTEYDTALTEWLTRQAP